MEGQISDAEFNDVLTRANYKEIVSSNIFITIHKNTKNYWLRHPDGSWTNIECKTI